MIRSISASSTADTTKVRCRTTYQRIFSFGVCIVFMKTRSRWIEEIATIDAATFSLSPPASSLPSQPSAASRDSPWFASMRETKFS